MTDTGLEPVQAGMPVQAVEALRAELEPLPGLSGEGRVNANGRSNGFTLTLPPGMPEPLRAQRHASSWTSTRTRPCVRKGSPLRAAWMASSSSG